MPSTFSPIDPATIAALNAGDERALEQIYRAHHDLLIERATERLKEEPAAVPRLVVAAVRELWEERAGFHSAAEIEVFLHEEFRYRARAIHSRMASVHRFEKTEGVKSAPHVAHPTADQIWADIYAALHKPVVDTATAARDRRERARYDAAGHIKHVGDRESLKVPMIVGGIGIIVVVGALLWMNRTSREAVVVEMLAAAEAEAITTRAGQLGSLALNDGSTARLGPESRLVVVPRFGREYRTLRLTGTGAFTVAPGNEVSFDAHLGDVVVTSEGGAISLRDYADDPFCVIRVEDGSARVRSPVETRSLTAGQSVVVDHDGTMRDATADEVAQAFAWTEGRLVLRDVPASMVASQLSRWFAMQVTIPDSSAAARRVSIDVPLESSQAAISAMERGANLRFVWEDNRMVFRDAGAALGAARR